VPASKNPSRPRTSRRPGARRRAGVALVAASGLLAACTGGSTDDASPEPSATPVVLRSSSVLPDAPATVVPDGDAAATAIAVSEALFAEAPVAVLVAEDEPALVAPAASVAVALGAPVLVAGPDAVADELERLGTTDAVLLGGVDPAGLPADVRPYPVDGTDPEALADLGVELGEPEDVRAGSLVDAVAALERPEPALLAVPTPEPEPSEDATGNATGEPSAEATDEPNPARTDDADDRPAVLGAETTTIEVPDAPDAAALLVDTHADAPGTAPAAATARAAGLPVVDVPGGDPRASTGTVEGLTGMTTVVAVGSSFGDARRLGPRAAAAATGVELPGGGQLVFPDPAAAPGIPAKRYVALYGTPGTPSLGVLGEQDTPATIARAQQTAAPYDALTDDTVIPTLEIIATIASAGPEPDGSYSRPRSIEDLRPLVEAAGEAGQAVVIDLQPGRTDFVTQAQQFAPLLEYPHVGLALDPEWRLAPDQVHLRQIGSVGIDEVNATAAWLAQFTRDRQLPQKMFLLHQFSLRMITDRERLDTSHDDLAMIIHADGQGSQPAKAGTWQTLHQGAPDVHWGWKNFYDEDTPMLDPAQTYAVQPVPDLVTYQ
jgi:hypothetical protein